MIQQRASQTAWWRSIRAIVVGLCVVMFAHAVALAGQPQPRSLYVMKLDGSGVRHIVHVAGYGSIESPRWSHDGMHLAFGALTKGAASSKLFVVKSDGSDLRELGGGSLPTWSPDDKQLAFTATADGGENARCWVQNVTGAGRQSLCAGDAPRWSPDGDRMALVNGGRLVMYDLILGAEGDSLDEIPGQPVAGFDWSPDGSQLAVVFKRDNRDELWVIADDSSKANRRMRLAGRLDGQLSWSPDGKRLAISSEGRIRLLDVAGTAAPEEISGQQGDNRMPDWSPDGQSLAFVSDRHTPDFAEQPVPSGRWGLEELARHRTGTIVYSLAFTPDGRRVVTGGDPVNHGVHVLDLASGKVTSLGGHGIRIAMFPDGRRFATGWHSPLIQLISIETGEIEREMTHGSANVRALAVSPDGRRLVSGGLDKLLNVWDPTSGELLLSFDKHQSWITTAIFSPDGREVISADHGKTVRVWDVETGKQRLELQHPATVWSLATSPDGQYILTGTGGSVATTPEALKIVPGDDNTLRVWDASRGALMREMKGHVDAVFSIDVSPAGRLAATGGWDGEIRLWDLLDGEELNVIDDRQGRAPHVSFSPDGQLLIVGGGGRRIDRQIVEFPDEQIGIYRLVEPPADDHPREAESKQ